MIKRDLRFQLAMQSGEQIAREFGFTGVPTDPFEIAKAKDILVAPKPVKAVGVSGFLMKVGDDFAITYATDIDNAGRQRFTVAHELGHYFLAGHPEYLFANGSSVHSSRSGFVAKDPYELEADHFAAGLLMPSEPFRRAMQDAGEGFLAIEALAARCQTSLTATAVRYAECSDEPVAVVVSEGDQVDFCFMSERIRDLDGIDWLRRGCPIARATQTHRFNRDRSNIALCHRAEAWTTLDLWFDGAPEVEMKEDVVGLGGYGKTLTVLFTDEVIEEDDESNDDW